MTGAWESVLARWGQEMTVVRGGERFAVRAFIESCADEEPVTAKTPLGAVERGRWLYLGSGRQEVRRGDGVEWGERRFIVEDAEAVFVGARVSHYRARLRAAKEAAV